MVRVALLKKCPKSADCTISPLSISFSSVIVRTNHQCVLCVCGVRAVCVYRAVAAGRSPWSIAPRLRPPPRPGQLSKWTRENKRKRIKCGERKTTREGERRGERTRGVGGGGNGVHAGYGAAPLALAHDLLLRNVARALLRADLLVAFAGPGLLGLHAPRVHLHILACVCACARVSNRTVRGVRVVSRVVAKKHLGSDVVCDDVELNGQLLGPDGGMGRAG